MEEIIAKNVENNTEGKKKIKIEDVLSKSENEKGLLELIEKSPPEFIYEFIELLGGNPKYLEYAEEMSKMYEDLSSEPHAEEYNLLINSAPEIDGIRKVWEILLNRILISSIDTSDKEKALEDFLNKIILIPNVTSSAYKDKNGYFFVEMIKNKLNLNGGEDSTNTRQNIEMILIDSMPSAFGMRDKLKEIFA
ncbi:MAG: hypothetical protein AAB513_01375 [Patescibacteria group bacterium]